MSEQDDRDPDLKNMTRYDRPRTSFEGWRVCISRQGLMFTKYFADHAYGGDAEACKVAARGLRNEILARLLTEPASEVIPEYQRRFAKKSRS